MFALLRPTTHAHATTREGFYGWRVVVLAGLALGMTAPGQTVGISVFVDHLIEDLSITRSTLSALYLIGTLSGAFALPVVGRIIDRWGVRRTMTAVAAAFGAALISSSQVTGLLTLTLAFVALRMLGQGSLTLTATTSVVYWFDRRRGAAVGITSATGQGLMSLAPFGLAAVIAAVGWRNTWILAGATLIAVLVPLAALLMRDGPGELGQEPDGDHRGRHDDDTEPAPRWGLSRAEAMRTPMFWTVTAAIATSAMIGTGLTFHQISILGERGLTATQAAAAFIPITAAAIASTMGFGWLVDRVSPRAVLAGAMCALAGGLLLVQHVSPGPSVLIYAVLLGTSGGAVRTIEGAVVPNLFGTLHVGAIRGAVMTATVAASAFGPVAIAGGADLLGGYPPILNLLLTLPAAAALAALFTRTPAEDPPARPGHVTASGEGRG